MKIILSLFFTSLLLPSMLFSENKHNNIEQKHTSVIVFMYHRFGESKYPSTNIRLEQFEKHLDYLQQNNYIVWPLSKIIRHLLKGEDIPRKTVALTIDDAYSSTYEKAYPMLKNKKFPFTVFVNTQSIEYESTSYMTWNQMREMQSYGAEFANHSLSHDFLLPRDNESGHAWKKRLKYEIQGAQQILQEKLGSSTNENPKLFSYPFGEYSVQTAEFIQSMGYIGITQTSGPIDMQSDTRTLPRFAMSEAFGDMDGFSLKLQTIPLPMASASPKEPLMFSNNPPILTIKLRYPIKKLQCYLGNGEELQINWISQTEFHIQAKDPLLIPRDRYTCTAPIDEYKWYWYSHLWIVK